MSLPREFVNYLCTRITEELIKREMVEVKNQNLLRERIHVVTEEELAVEEQINEEVRNILRGYAEEMRQTGVSYQEMFKKVKNKLVKEKKVIL
jgi:hypothetical protein